METTTLTAAPQSTAPAASLPSTYVPAPPGLAIMGFERQYQPQPGTLTSTDLRHALNPLHYVPGVGMIYRAATGEDLPAPLIILGSVAVGAATAGPLGVLGALAANFTQMLMSLGPAVPGHTLLATDYPATSDGPVPQTSNTGSGITYADGSKGSPTWAPGQLTNFDMTLSQAAAGADTGSDEVNHDLAMAAYQRTVAAFGGLANL